MEVLWIGHFLKNGPYILVDAVHERFNVVLDLKS